jgi:O-methyltransferase domain
MTDAVAVDPAEKMRLRAALIEQIGGYMTAHAMGVAAELKIADFIKDDVRSSADLAAETDTHEPSLRRLLRMLASVGFIVEPEPGRFALTDVGRQLRSDSPDSLHAFTLMFCHPLLISSWQGLMHSVRTGEHAFDHVHGREFYDYLAEHKDVSALFNVAMSEESRISAAQVAAGHDFADAKTVVDLGGGDGTLMAAILTAHPHLQGIVVDSPSGVAEAPGVLRAAGVADRCDVRPGDFFKEVPADADLYIVKSVFQDWNDEDSAAILRSCRAHMPDSATLLVIGSVLPETASTSVPIMFFTDLNMLVNSGGRERTESEFRTLLDETGFDVQSVAHGAAGPLSIIQAVPA